MEKLIDAIISQANLTNLVLILVVGWLLKDRADNDKRFAASIDKVTEALTALRLAFAELKRPPR